MEERVTETFRGLHCRRHANQWQRAMAPFGWRLETFGGVSGVGSFKACSMTLVRVTLAPPRVDATQRAYAATLGSGLPREWADRVIASIQSAGITFMERVG